MTKGAVATGTAAKVAQLCVVGLQNGSHLLAVGSEYAEAVPGWPRSAVCPFCSAKRAREAFCLEANPSVDEPLAVQRINEFEVRAHSSKDPVCKSVLLSISLSCVPVIGSCDRKSLN